MFKIASKEKEAKKTEKTKQKATQEVKVEVRARRVFAPKGADTSTDLRAKAKQAGTCLSTWEHAVSWKRTGSVLALAVLDSGFVLSGSYGDYAVKRWQVDDKTGKVKHSNTWPPRGGDMHAVNALLVLPNGLVLTGESGANCTYEVRCWQIDDETGRGHHVDAWKQKGGVLALAVLDNGLVLSGGFNKTIKCWRVNDKTGKAQCVSTWEGHTGSVRVLAVLPNGLVLSGSDDKTIKCWRVNDKTGEAQCVSTWEGHKHWVVALAVLPNGLVLSGGFDKTIKCWRVNDKTGEAQCVSTWEGHTGSVRVLAVLPNGLVLSGSDDKTIKCWWVNDKTEEAQCVSTWEGHTGSVMALLVLPNGLVLSGSGLVVSWSDYISSSDYTGYNIDTDCYTMDYINSTNSYGEIKCWQGVPATLEQLMQKASKGDITAQVTCLRYHVAGKITIDEKTVLDYAVTAANRQCFFVKSLVEPLVAQGNDKAQFVMAQYYHARRRVDESLKWYRLSAEQGNTDAQAGLLRLAKADNQEAQVTLAVMYEEGQGFKEDIDVAISWYRCAAAQGHAWALMTLSRLAEASNQLTAQWILAELYAKGQGVKQDDVLAMKWYTVAAKREHRDAQLALGGYYAAGRGVDEDIPHAVYWYHRSAAHGQSEALARLVDLADKQGSQPAQLAYGILLMTCLKPTDEFKARLNLETVYVQHKLQAAGTYLGLLAEHGLKQRVSAQAAHVYYQAAADDDCPLAKILLGVSYLVGLTGKTNEAQALQLFEQARSPGEDYQLAVYVGAPVLLARLATSGSLSAMLALAVIYEQGLPGVSQDLTKATSYYQQAVSQGCSWEKARVAACRKSSESLSAAQPKMPKQTRSHGKKSLPEQVPNRLQAAQQAAEIQQVIPPASSVSLLPVQSSKVPSSFSSSSSSSSKEENLLPVRKGSTAAGTLKPDGKGEVDVLLDYADLTCGELIAVGGFGEVYRGQWLNSTEVAIKKLLQRTLNRQLEQAFRQEAGVMVRLRGSHPNIINLYGVVLLPEPCMVLEFMAKGSLYDVLHSDEPLSWKCCYQMGLDAARGLLYLHGKRILHRDLKSRNVLVDEYNRAKLSDFGLAKVASSSQMYGAGIPGTTQWVAPELFHGEKYTPACDVYSFAIVLWELLSRQVPYRHKVRGAISGFVQNGGRETLPPDSPSSLQALVLRCWAQIPKDRSNMKSVVKTLQAEPITNDTPIPSLHVAGGIQSDEEDDAMWDSVLSDSSDYVGQTQSDEQLVKPVLASPSREKGNAMPLSPQPLEQSDYLPGSDVIGAGRGNQSVGGGQSASRHAPGYSSSSSLSSTLFKPAATPPPPLPEDDSDDDVIEAAATRGYLARDASQLTLVKGARLTVIEQQSSGWWLCELDGKRGLAPSNHLQLVMPETATQQQQAGSGPSPLA